MICLVMIVRNEGKTIQRTLASVLPHVDCAVIVDTGSDDNTEDLASIACARYQQDSGGGLREGWQMYRRPWVDFSTNRNEAIQLARDMLHFKRDRPIETDWLLMLDGDSVLECDYTPVFRGLLYARTHTAYAIKATLGTLKYPQVRLFRADSDWRYEGKVHEVPISPRGDVYGHLPDAVQVRYLGTDAGQKEATWREHLKLLTLQRKEERGKNPRTVFYIAQTYHCLGDFPHAAMHYAHRVKMTGGSSCERWEAMLRLGTLDTVYADVQRERRLIECTKIQPMRAEPWYELARLYATRAEERDSDDIWEQAYVTATIAAQKEEVQHALFLRKDVYDYRAQMVLGVAAYHTNRYREALDVFEALLQRGATDTRIGPDEAEVLLMRQHVAHIRRLNDQAKGRQQG